MPTIISHPEPYYSDDAITLYLGDALAVLATMPDQSVDCCVTSPPYFGLRDYGEDGQYGLEASPAEYVETMRAVFAEVRRVLADDGTCWLNIGDSYSGKANAGATVGPGGGHGRPNVIPKRRDTTSFAPYKSLHLIPHKVAIALMEDGWVVRSEVIWAKRNMLPERVDDRPTRAHEQVFLLTKKASYWYDAEAIRMDGDPEQTEHNERYAREYPQHTANAAAGKQPGNVNNVGIHARPGKPGRNARTVWWISAQPFDGEHSAVMPLLLAERCVIAGCKPGGIVLDPFSGSGTSGLAAVRHGRKYVGIDLSAKSLTESLATRFAQPGLNLGEVSA